MYIKPRPKKFSHDFAPESEYMTVRAYDDSMRSAGIFNDSVVVVHKQRTAVDGDIVVVTKDNMAYLRNYKQFGETVMLMPANPEYEAFPFIPGSDMLILGKVVQATTFY